MLVSLLDTFIMYCGFSPDLILRLAFAAGIIEAGLILFLGLYLLIVVGFKKNFNYLKKTNTSLM